MIFLTVPVIRGSFKESLKGYTTVQGVGSSGFRAWFRGLGFRVTQ